MGGYGSGLASSSSPKAHTSDLASLDIRWLTRHGYLTSTVERPVRWYVGDTEWCSILVRASGRHIRLRYQQNHHKDSFEQRSYTVSITRTTCHYGGDRPWFLCPAPGCSRRVAILYGGNMFACRRCHDLVYPSQRELLDIRLMRSADKLRSVLGWPLGIANPTGEKPKHMHWKTFASLMDQHDALTMAAFGAIQEETRKIEEYVERKNSHEAKQDG
jgi:hypothetical protein